ncbi:MAG: hypothetical protein GX913_03835 [Clostridiales bacterium]|nr:hypothetical protein [Clostridiales bacterium]
MKKMQYIVFILLVIVIMATACSEKKLEANTDTVFIEGKNNIIGALVETFDKPYYNGDELQRFIESELALYNSEIDSTGIIVNKFEVTDEAAKVFLQYASQTDYAKFNEVEFFVGTVEEALEAGYDFNEDFVNYTKLTKVSKEDVTEKKKNKVLITDEDTLAQVNGTIVYISDNVKEKSKKSAQLTGENLSYIIYK